MNLKEVLGDAYKEGMTFEEVEAALEKVNVPEDNSAEIERLKNALSKSNSEAAGYKKQLREKMTEDEQKKQKEQEEREELQNKYDKLLRESIIAKNKAKLVALGYDESLADETAEAMADGDSEKVLPISRSTWLPLRRRFVRKLSKIHRNPPMTGIPRP